MSGKTWQQKFEDWNNERQRFEGQLMDEMSELLSERRHDNANYYVIDRLLLEIEELRREVYWWRRLADKLRDGLEIQTSLSEAKMCITGVLAIAEHDRFNKQDLEQPK